MAGHGKKRSSQKPLLSPQKAMVSKSSQRKANGVTRPNKDAALHRHEENGVSAQCLVIRGWLHDLKNVVTGILSLSELYCYRLEPDDALFSGLSEIKQCALEARQLLQKISDFTHNEPLPNDYHDVKTLLRDQIDAIKTLFPLNTKIHLKLPNEDLPIYIDRNGFRSMILGLALNAKEVCANTENIQITIGAQKIPSGEAVFAATKEATFITSLPGVEISFQDNGKSITSSTKSPYNAQQFIEKNAGKVALDGQPGKGNTFYIFFTLATFPEK